MTTASRTKNVLYSLATIALAMTPLAPALADDAPLLPGAGFSVSGGHSGPIRADGHAPIGIMGDHVHKKGEWMFSYRYMHMDMDGSRIGTRNVSPQTIVSTVPNRFAGMMDQPATLRIVPLWMTMDMHMLGAMYAPTNDLTIMAMANYLEKEMRHITYQGGMGTTPLGLFTTKSEGIGDTRITGLYQL
ncbi:MAG: transporter, partial [Alphaproteobacteria bacterium]